jgi:hypothetical protein
MNKNILIILLIVSTIALFIALSKQQKPIEEEVPVATEQAGKMCFLNKIPVSVDYGDGEIQEGNNYEFFTFELQEGLVNNGVFYYFPFESDSQRGSFTGTYNPETKAIQTIEQAWGEGQSYEQQGNYVLGEKGLELNFTNQDGSTYVIPQIDCETYQSELDLFLNDRLASSVNTTDRTRVAKLPIFEGQVTQEMIDQVSFQEVAFDFDRNYETEEYLIYLNGMDFCGSGGCTMYVVDQNSKVLSKMTVTDTPIYTDLLSFEESEQMTSWNNLYVWSDGSYRVLKHNGTSYPSNPSVEPAIEEGEIINHPEKYLLLLK